MVRRFDHPATSSPVVTLLATLAFVVSQFHLGYLLHQLRPNVLVLQLTFDADRYWAILQAWGDDGLRAYRAHFPYDFAHLFIYALFGRVLATRAGLFAPDEAWAARCCAWLLPVAALFDLAENLLQLHLLAGPAGAPDVAVPLSAGCSAVKWGLAALFALLIGARVARKCARIGRASQ